MPLFWSQLLTSQSAPSAAGSTPPMTQPKKRPELIAISPGSASVGQLVDHRPPADAGGSSNRASASRRISSALTRGGTAPLGQLASQSPRVRGGGPQGALVRSGRGALSLA